MQSILIQRSYLECEVYKGYTFTSTYGSTTFNTVVPIYITKPFILVPSTTEEYGNETTLYYDSNGNSWNSSENRVFFHVQLALYYARDLAAQEWLKIVYNKQNITKFCTEFKALLQGSVSNDIFYIDSPPYGLTLLAKGAEEGGVLNEYFIKPSSEALNPTNILNPYTGLFYQQYGDTTGITINRWWPDQSSPAQQLNYSGSDVRAYINLPFKPNVTSKNYKVGATKLFEPIDYIDFNTSRHDNESTPPPTRFGPEGVYMRLYCGIAPKGYWGEV